MYLRRSLKMLKHLMCQDFGRLVGKQVRTWNTIGTFMKHHISKLFNSMTGCVSFPV